ncbi:sigma factor-like helix-turn-helix DNA-binding protein [Cellulomonas sp. NPDC055163]
MGTIPREQREVERYEDLGVARLMTHAQVQQETIGSVTFVALPEYNYVDFGGEWVEDSLGRYTVARWREAGPRVAVIDSTVRTVNTRDNPQADADDVRQAARLYIATASDRFRESGGGVHRAELRSRVLRDLPGVKEDNASDAAVAREAEAVRDAEVIVQRRDRPIGGSLRETPDDYTVGEVEASIPLIWDESFALGSLGSYEPGMPPPPGDPSRTGGRIANAADLRTAWNALSDLQRRRLLLCFGLGWTHAEIAQHDDVSEESVRQSVKLAVQRLVKGLNSGEAFRTTPNG